MAVRRAGDELMAARRSIEANEPASVAKPVGQAIGRAMTGIYFEVLKHVWEQYPELVPDDPKEGPLG
jgi:hypothetical protein